MLWSMEFGSLLSNNGSHSIFANLALMVDQSTFLFMKSKVNMGERTADSICTSGVRNYAVVNRVRGHEIRF